MPPVRPRIRSVDDLDLARWQSAVREVAKSITGPDARLHRLSPRAHDMHVAAADHVVRDFHRRDVPVPPDPGESDLSHSHHRWLSKAFYEIARARLEGREARAEEIEAETRKYSTADTAGWASCVTTYLKYYAGGVKDPIYRDWKNQGGGNLNYGVVQWTLPADAKIAVIGDWGTGMADARALVEQIVAQLRPDAFLHLGDIYYSGTPDETQEHVLDVFDEVFEKTGAPRVPVFLVPGNHEYYARGEGFYPMIDEINSGIAGAQQQASYFCLRSEDGRWQFLGMDTGVQDNNPITPFGPTYVEKGLLPSELTWHADKISGFAGNTILLSHHQLFSANNAINGSLSFEPAYLNTNLFNTLGPYFDKVSAWLWGHEHNYVLFENGQFGLNMGRCLGHSGYEETEAETPYAIENGEVVYLPGMKQLTVTDGYYWHGAALIDLGARVNPEDPIAITYYEFPSWGQDDPTPDPLPPLTELNSETIGDPVARPKWTGNQKISAISGIDPASTDSPAMAWMGDYLFCVYKGAWASDLYQMQFDGRTWTGNKKIKDLPGGISPKSSAAPGLAAFGPGLTMIYKGSWGSTLYYATFDGERWAGNKKISSMPGKISPESSDTPGVCVFQGGLSMVYTGAHSTDLYYASFDGQTWSGNTKISKMPGGISPQSSTPPACIAYGDLLYVVYSGMLKNDLYVAWYDGQRWAGNKKISDISPIAPESDARVTLSLYADSIYMLYKGAHTDTLYQAVFNDSGWSGNVKISDISTIDPESSAGPGSSPFTDGLIMTYPGATLSDLYTAKLAPSS